MSKDDDDKSIQKSASLESIRDTYHNISKLKEASCGLAAMAATRSLTESSALKAAMVGMDIQRSLGLSGLASVAAARGLTESAAIKASMVGMYIQKSLGLSGLASVAAARGLTESAAIKASMVGMDIQKSLGLSGLASMAAAARNLTESPALKASMCGMDIQKNQGILGLATKAAAIGLTDTFALKASMLGMNIQKNLGIAGLASKVAAMGLADNPALKASMLGMNIQNNREMFGLASQVVAMGFPYKPSIGKSNILGDQATVKDLLASPEVEKAFSHLIDENDFEETANKLYCDNANTRATGSNGVPDGSLEIQPFDPNKSFLEWYDKLNPISKHAITAVFAILLSIIANLLTPFVENLIHTQKHETKAIIRSYKNSNYESFSIDNQYRFVSATRLHVREKPITDSAIIATATLGRVVSVDHKKKGWAKISYLDENDDVVIGWVLLRYVSNFKK